MTIAIACFCVAAYFIAASLVGKLLQDSARRSAHMAAVDALNKITGGER